jgi:hypothetical protein
MNAAIVVVGIGLLIFFAVLIGASMDTDRQRVQAKRAAAARRALAQERRQLDMLRDSIAEERRRLDRARRRLAEEESRAATNCNHPDCPRR